jgi:hypothetical protein
MFKIFFSSLLAVLFISINSYSQTFIVTAISPSPVYASAYSTDIASIFGINNTTNSPITLRFIRQNVSIPSRWTTAMCDIHLCYPNFVDTTPWVSYSPGLDTPNSAHFYPDSTPGSGSFTIRVEKQGSSEFHALTFSAVAWPIGIKIISSTVTDFRLNQNYPNPFNPSTKINFSIPKNEYTDLRIYDILGREVAVLVSGPVSAGEYEVEWDAKNLASGMYYYRLKTRENVAVKKMTLVK